MRIFPADSARRKISSFPSCQNASGHCTQKNMTSFCPCSWWDIH
jgi:hypothetical protein